MDISFSNKMHGVMPYASIGLASANIKFENNWIEFWERDWVNRLDFLKISAMDFVQMKPYGSTVDGFNNKANNTKESCDLSECT